MARTDRLSSMPLLLGIVSMLVVFQIQTTEGASNYAKEVEVSSSGPAANIEGSSMGVYSLTDLSHSGRPVWQSTARADRYLFYNDLWNRWVIAPELTNQYSVIVSEKTDPSFPWLVKGWKFWNGNDWQSDGKLYLSLPIQTVVGDAYHIPEKLIVSSTGKAASAQSSILGEFRITEAVNAGKPVWQKRNRGDTIYLFYNDKWGRWGIGHNYKQSLITSVKTGMQIPPEQGWSFWNGYDWQFDDDTLTVTPVTEGIRNPNNLNNLPSTHPSTLPVTSNSQTYPQKLTVSTSTGSTLEVQGRSMGVYRMTDRTNSGRPVWQSTVRNDRYLFYNGDWAVWVIFERVTNERAMIKSKETGLTYIPNQGWMFWSNSAWEDSDHTLTVTEGEPQYPQTLTVSSSGSAASKQGPSMGEYRMIELTNAGRPVWQSTVRHDRYLYYNGGWAKWIIGKVVDNNSAIFKSQKRGLLAIPEVGWEFWDEIHWEDSDHTLRVRGPGYQGPQGGQGNIIHIHQNTLNCYTSDCIQNNRG